jgi:hypothetical protein
MSPIVKSFLSVSAAYLLDASRGRSAERPDLGPHNPGARSTHPNKAPTTGPRSAAPHWGRHGARLG